MPRSGGNRDTALCLQAGKSLGDEYRLAGEESEVVEPCARCGSINRGMEIVATGARAVARCHWRADEAEGTEGRTLAAGLRFVTEPGRGETRRAHVLVRDAPHSAPASVPFSACSSMSKQPPRLWLPFSCRHVP